MRHWKDKSHWEYWWGKPIWSMYPESGQGNLQNSRNSRTLRSSRKLFLETRSPAGVSTGPSAIENLRHSDEGALKLYAKTISDEVLEKMYFTCETLRTIVNIFFNNHQKISNERKRKSQVADYKKRQRTLRILCFLWNLILFYWHKTLIFESSYSYFRPMKPSLIYP